jgi:hypothetical protein
MVAPCVTWMIADCRGAVPLRKPFTIPYVGSIVGVARTASPTVCAAGEGEVDGELDGEGEAEGELDGEVDGEADGEGEVAGDGEGEGEPQFP